MGCVNVGIMSYCKSLGKMRERRKRKREIERGEGEREGERVLILSVLSVLSASECIDLNIDVLSPRIYI